MNDPVRPAFGASDVIEITSKFAADDDAFIIGGQATNFWAWFYEDKETFLQQGGPFTSEDIDYFGTKEVAQNVANALGGELLLPDPGDHTPSTAQIITAIHGHELKIDFLRAVLGVHHHELKNGVSVFEISAELDGRPTTVLIKILHPQICLKSRIVNMLHPATRRTDRFARAQTEAAVVILRRYIDEALGDEEGWKEAKRCFRQLYQDLRSNEFVKVADIKLGIDPLTILRSFVDDERIDKRYRESQLRKMVARIEGRRAGRHNRFVTKPFQTIGSAENGIYRPSWL